MTGLRRTGKKAIEFMMSPQELDVAYQKFTTPTAAPGNPTWPATERDLKNIGFHWDKRDRTRQVLDTRPGAAPGTTRTANVFHWQAAAQAESRSIQNWVRRNGFHAVITTIEVPQDATLEEFKEIMAAAAEGL
ncbi:uncharacterized protein N7518_005903 [Penicillium psychrosexuale]|uniref:uncharacterized protein n=1 Tax=Penicillium psychrosexuale TaxID=1002107 RepID=UPI002545048F|nr:uncharacterized protein N7518_005903 [Penicillium psychrosexuale]KAJ5788892.1 hypothetical protein N7518_005903 [Penicillium psychrosexuale]